MFNNHNTNLKDTFKIYKYFLKIRQHMVFDYCNKITIPEICVKFSLILLREQGLLCQPMDTYKLKKTVASYFDALNSKWSKSILGKLKRSNFLPGTPQPCQ